MKRKAALLVVAAVVAVSLGFVAFDIFAPKATTTRSETADPSATMLAQGSFTGADRAHNVEGTVQLLADADGQYLFFSNYDATSGPDVYWYLTPDANGHYHADAIKLLAPGGAEDGQATLRGDFRLDIPAGVDATQFGGITVWCDDFNVEFGSAGWQTLQP